MSRCLALWFLVAGKVVSLEVGVKVELILNNFLEAQSMSFWLLATFGRGCRSLALGPSAPGLSD